MGAVIRCALPQLLRSARPARSFFWPGAIATGSLRFHLFSGVHRALSGAQKPGVVLLLPESAPAFADPGLHRFERSVFLNRLGVDGGGGVFSGCVRSRIRDQKSVV